MICYPEAELHQLTLGLAAATARQDPRHKDSMAGRNVARAVLVGESVRMHPECIWLFGVGRCDLGGDARRCAIGYATSSDEVPGPPALSRRIEGVVAA